MTTTPLYRWAVRRWVLEESDVFAPTRKEAMEVVAEGLSPASVTVTRETCVRQEQHGCRNDADVSPAAKRQKAFQDQLDFASRVVSTRPRWKQNCLTTGPRHGTTQSGIDTETAETEGG